MINTERDVFSKGLAVVWQDMDGFYARFRNEDFRFKSLRLDNSSPARCIYIFNVPELRFARVAKIDEVRKCAELNQAS